MGYFKTFMLGVTTAFCIYYITRKGDDGLSILDEILERPSELLIKVKDLAIGEAVKTIKERI